MAVHLYMQVGGGIEHEDTAVKYFEGAKSLEDT